MKFSLSLAYADPHELIDLAQTAERAGFFGIAMGEHLLHPVDIGSDYPYKPDRRAGRVPSITTLPY